MENIRQKLCEIIPDLDLTKVDLTEDQKHELEQLILSHLTAFALTADYLGHTDAVLFDIDTSDHKPIK